LLLRDIFHLPEVHHQMRTHRLPLAKNRSKLTAQTILARILSPRPAFKEEEQAMDGKAAGSRKRIEIVCVLIVAGIVPFSGCAVPSTMADSIPAWMRPWQATSVAAAQRDSAPANLAAGPTVYNGMRTSYPQSHPAMTPAGEYFASSAPPCLPPQLPYSFDAQPPGVQEWPDHGHAERRGQ